MTSSGRRLRMAFSLPFLLLKRSLNSLKIWSTKRINVFLSKCSSTDSLGAFARCWSTLDVLEVAFEGPIAATSEASLNHTGNSSWIWLVICVILAGVKTRHMCDFSTSSVYQGVSFVDIQIARLQFCGLWLNCVQVIPGNNKCHYICEVLQTSQKSLCFNPRFLVPLSRLISLFVNFWMKFVHKDGFEAITDIFIHFTKCLQAGVSFNQPYFAPTDKPLSFHIWCVLV